MLDCRDHDDGVGRYSSTKDLLMDSLEKEGDVQYSSARAEKGVWLG